MADTVRAPFDLVDRPWILVNNQDGQVEEVSLLELLERAHELRSVLGEIPTQTFAIVRLLLAILHRAVDGPPDAAGWGHLWRDRTLPVADVTAYLDHFRARFDLLSPDTPFYQVAGLRTAKGDTSRLDRLIADVPVGYPFFTTRVGSGIARLSFAEAARWLVHCQAFDPSGIKSGALGDDRVKNGKGYPIGTGWAGMLGGVLAEGPTVRETLLLNLVPEGLDKLTRSDEDIPAWERNPQEACPEFAEGHVPAGPLELYTWQSRRVRLFHDHDGVHGVLIANGDKITPQNRHVAEPMSVWRRSTNQEKSTGVVPTYMPRQHEPERAIWRGLAAILEHNRNGTQETLRPVVLDWLSEARSDGVLEDSYQIRTRAIGMQYGSQSATTTEVVDDAVSLSVLLLGESGRELRAEAIAAVRDAEEAARALGNLAYNLAEAAGGDGTGPRAQAQEVAYARLDGPFRTWLAGLVPGTSPTEARTRWQIDVLRMVRDLGRDMIEHAGPAAWRGRTVRDRHVSTPEADGWFQFQLRKHFTYAHSTDTTEVPA